MKRLSLIPIILLPLIFLGDASTTALAVAPLIDFSENTQPTSIPIPTKETNTNENIDVTGQSRTWNLKNVDIRTVIAEVGAETGKNFIIDPRVQGQVTLLSSTPMSPAELYQVFLTLLDVNGFAAVGTNDTVKIIPLEDAKTGDLPMDYQHRQNASELAVRVMHVESAPVKDFIQALKPLMGKGQIISFYEPANDLILVGTVKKNRNIEEIVRQLDKRSDNTDVIILEHAAAEELAKTLTDLEKTDSQFTKPSVKIVGDERTNSILITGNRTRLSYYRNLVRKLDIESTHAGNTQVIYLKYVAAKDIAPIIGNLIENYQKKEGGPVQAQPSSTGGGTPDSVNLGARFIQRQGQSADQSSQLSSSGDTTIMGNTGLPESNEPKSGTAGQAVQWEDATNSLIIKAPPGLMRTVKSVINKLDIRRPQVLVEAIVAEVSISRLRELGVELNTDGSIPVSTRFPSVTGQTTQLDSTLGGSGADTIVGSGLTIGFLNNSNLRAVVTALGRDSNANILATPNIVTLDNETANIRVGQLVPFAIGASTNTLDSGGTPFTSFRREEVGLSMTIRPQITQSGAIKLHIENILSSIVPDAVGAGDNPITSERVITTNVMVDDGSILVLGGLIQKEWQIIHQKVPLLGDVPIIGRAFRHDNRQLVKRNLMIFLKPVIMRDSIKNREVSSEKYHHMRKLQLDTTDRLDVPFRKEAVALPNLGPKHQLPSPFDSLPK